MSYRNTKVCSRESLVSRLGAGASADTKGESSEMEKAGGSGKDSKMGGLL